MDIHCYEHDQGFVLERFKNGESDYVDSASEKEEVPTWFYLASNLSMRLHGIQSFHAYPYVVRCGGMLNVFGPDVAHKATHPETGDVTLSCQGFNDKEASFRPYQPPQRESLVPPRLPQSPPRVRKRELKRRETVKKNESPPLPPEKIVLKTEVAGIEGFRSFTQCPIPVNVIINREVCAST